MIIVFIFTEANYSSTETWETTTIIIQDPKITKKINLIALRIKKKTSTVIINRVPNIVLGHRLLHRSCLFSLSFL
ncbi:unnamed protein product [Schistosoma margrebowiei]|uniref:Uncharacterized protein n=1 Tax=Schistosoma margrebowiei TaxID=48269 RepID=A0AA84ZA43_9TREM|nr:unnamed protein product [Schistosoma margrebowiei]